MPPPRPPHQPCVAEPCPRGSGCDGLRGAPHTRALCVLPSTSLLGECLGCAVGGGSLPGFRAAPTHPEPPPRRSRRTRCWRCRGLSGLRVRRAKGGSLPPGSPPATCYASDLTAVPAVLRARQGSCFRCVCGRAPSKLRSLRMPRKVCRRLNPPSRLGTPACDRSHAGRAEEKRSRDGETQAKGAGADTARAYEQGAERRGRGRFGSFAVASSTTFCHTHSHFADGFWLFVFLSTLNLLDGFCRSGAAAGTPRRRLRRLQWQRAYVRGKTGRQRAEQSDVGPRDGGMTWRGGAVT